MINEFQEKLNKVRAAADDIAKYTTCGSASVVADALRNISDLIEMLERHQARSSVFVGPTRLGPPHRW